MEASNTGQVSRAMSRWHSAKGFREAWDAFSDNPAELAISFAANSIGVLFIIVFLSPNITRPIVARAYRPATGI